LAQAISALDQDSLFAMCVGVRPSDTSTPASPRTLLPERVLGHISGWVKPRCLHSIRHTSRGHHAGLTPPEVPRELLKQLRSHLPIQREAAFFRLERLAKQGSGDAINAVLLCLQDGEQEQELRKWALELVGALAEPGEAWAVNAIVKPGGPLMDENDCVAQKALEVLRSVVDGGNVAALVALAHMLGDGRFSCRAGQTLAHVAGGATDIDSVAIQAVLEQLNAPSYWVQANAVTALGFVARRGDDTVLRELETKTWHANMDVRDRAVRALAQIEECRA